MDDTVMMTPRERMEYLKFSAYTHKKYGKYFEEWRRTGIELYGYYRYHRTQAKLKPELYQ